MILLHVKTYMVENDIEHHQCKLHACIEDMSSPAVCHTMPGVEATDALQPLILCCWPSVGCVQYKLSPSGEDLLQMPRRTTTSVSNRNNLNMVNKSNKGF